MEEGGGWREEGERRRSSGLFWMLKLEPKRLSDTIPGQTVLTPGRRIDSAL